MSGPQNSKLTQRRFFLQVQSFEITSDHNLLVSVKGPFKEESWTTPLAPIDPSPTRVKRVDLKPLVLVVPFALISIYTFCAAILCLWYGKEWVPFLTIAGLFGIPTAGCTWLIFRNSMNVLTFSSPNGVRLPLWFNNPAAQAFENFVSKLQESINAARAVRPEDQTLAGEIQKLKDLLDRGILDKDQFESAKNRLTGNEAQRRVGF